MGRFTWNKRDLLRSLDKVQKLIEKEKDPKELARLLLCYDRINATIYDSFIFPDLHLPLSKKTPGLFSSFLGNQIAYNLMDPFADAMIANDELFNETGHNRDSIEDKIEKATGTHVSKTKAISICYDFYRELDDELFQYYKRIYDMRFNHLRFNKPEKKGELPFYGMQHYLYGVDESYLEVFGTDNPIMSTTVIHESAHAIDVSMNPENYINDDYFSEVISTFLELVSFYKRAGNFDELFYHNSVVDNLDYFCDFIDDANSFANLMELYKENDHHITPEFYEQARRDYKIKKDDVKDILQSSSLNGMTYPISAGLAFYLFSIYKQDERKGLEELKKLIKTVDKRTYYPLLLSKEYAQVVNDEVKTSLQEANECLLRHK